MAWDQELSSGLMLLTFMTVHVYDRTPLRLVNQYSDIHLAYSSYTKPPSLAQSYCRRAWMALDSH